MSAAARTSASQWSTGGTLGRARHELRRVFRCCGTDRVMHLRYQRSPRNAAGDARLHRWRLARLSAARATRSAVRLSRSAEQTSELQSLMRTSYAVVFLKKKQFI